MWEGILGVRGRGDIGEHLSTWRSDIFGCEGFCDGDFWWCDVGIIGFFAKDGIEVREEHGKDGSRDVEGWGEDNADVADAHLVDVGVIDDANQEGGEGANEGPVGPWESMHQVVVCGDLLCLFIEI